MNSVIAPGPGVARTLERWSVLFASCVMTIAIASLGAWQWGIEWLLHPFPGWVAANPVSALAFLLAALSFFSLHRTKTSSRQRTAGNILAGIVLSIGAIGLASYKMPTLGSFDRILYTHSQQVDSLQYHVSNRMALDTACCFLFMGFALLRLQTEQSETDKRGWSPLETAALVTAFLSLTSLLGHLYRVREFYGSLEYLRMAIPSAVSFLLLAAALLLISPRQRITGVLTAGLAGSLMAKRLLPFAFLLPILLGLLRLIGYWEGLLSTELGLTLLLLSIIICFVYLLWHNALLLNNRDAQTQRAESDLAAMQSSWELMIDSVKDYAIFLVDPAGHVLTWNEGAQKIKGYKREEIVGQPISKFYTEEEIARDEPSDNLRIAAAAGRHYSEGWRVRKNGERFWAEIVFTAIYDDRHRVKAFAKITRDNTEQKLARARIAYQARLIEDSSDAMLSTDPEFRIVTWNKAAQNLYGYESAEAIGAVFGDLLRNQSSDPTRRAIRKELVEKGYWLGEVNLITKDDKAIVVALTISATRDDKDVFNGYIIVCRDMTRRVREEQRLQAFNELLARQVDEKTAELREIFERVTDAFMAYDKDGNIVYANPRALEMNRSRGLDLLGKNIWKAVPVAVTSLFGQHFRKAMALQQDQHFEMYSESLDLWLESHMYPSPNGISQFYRDITAQHQFQLQIEASNAQLRALASHLTDVREEERAAMAREVHDELGQQLTGIKMDLALMARKASSETNEWLQQKMEAALALLDTAIRTVRKIASELRPSILDDLGLIAALDWQAQEFGKRMNIPTTFVTNGDGTRIPSAAAIGLFRICQESLTNVARHAAAASVFVTLLEEPDSLTLTIRDDGRGIDKQRLDTNKKTLGLLGMKERALMMGGALTIESEPGKGMTLSVQLPLEPMPKPK